MDIMRFTETASSNVLPTQDTKQNKKRKKQKKRMWSKIPIP